MSKKQPRTAIGISGVCKFSFSSNFTLSGRGLRYKFDINLTGLKKKCYDRTIDSPSLFPQGKFPFIISDKVHWVDVEGCSSLAHCISSLYLCTREVSFAFSAVILVRRRVRCLDESAFDIKNYEQRNKVSKKWQTTASLGAKFSIHQRLPK